jgi:hypothetical protein
VVPSATLIGTSILPAWALLFSKRSDVDGTGKCTISEGGEGVCLAIYEIESAERTILDRCEGLGSGYNHFQFDDPEFGVCSAYIADEGSIDHSLMPVDWYKEYVLLGCEFNRFPRHYIDTVRRLRTCSDSDADRSRLEWQLVEEIRNARRDRR